VLEHLELHVRYATEERESACVCIVLYVGGRHSWRDSDSLCWSYDLVRAEVLGEDSLQCLTLLEAQVMCLHYT
jgi:hypothetical protein